jgi:hypothetical protein
MTQVALDFQIAFAAATEAANRSMRNAGRTMWNENDRDVGEKVMRAVWDVMYPPKLKVTIPAEMLSGEI